MTLGGNWGRTAYAKAPPKGGLSYCCLLLSPADCGLLVDLDGGGGNLQDRIHRWLLVFMVQGLKSGDNKYINS